MLLPQISMNSKLTTALLPLVGIILALTAWHLLSGHETHRTSPDGTTEEVKRGIVKDLPSPWVTWQKTKRYILQPFAKREDLDQGILRFTWYSLVLVAKGYALALLIGTPIGFFAGALETFQHLRHIQKILRNRAHTHRRI